MSCIPVRSIHNHHYAKQGANRHLLQMGNSHSGQYSNGCIPGKILSRHFFLFSKVKHRALLHQIIREKDNTPNRKGGKQSAKAPNYSRFDTFGKKPTPMDASMESSLRFTNTTLKR
ncbi:hypothetical protein Nepgr_011579 [Nepenthes gracilis]|uniref:Uncharacterized protein n=1 Tax=Nepenthes gracilis TaxID=150966 RepID=A0AAD3SEF8_NEPGR|nr:hypothetical protein Nepgr_011579 [Nepenthes gracilis]